VNKPREFYIYERKNESWFSYEINIVDGLTVQTRVIEYSAYEELKRDNEILEKNLVKSVIQELDGVAAVNLDEPTKDDLKRLSDENKRLVMETNELLFENKHLKIAINDIYYFADKLHTLIKDKNSEFNCEYAEKHCQHSGVKLDETGE